jgi:glutaredoxin
MKNRLTLTQNPRLSARTGQAQRAWHLRRKSRFIETEKAGIFTNKKVQVVAGTTDRLFCEGKRSDFFVESRDSTGDFGLTILFLFVMLFLSMGVRADLYQWVDEKGLSHVTTAPPPKKSSQQKVTVSEPVQNPSRAYSSSGRAAGPVGQGNKPLPFLQPSAAPQVEIYSASWCGFCKKTKAYFRARGVAFTEYDVEANLTAAARAKALNPEGGIPVTIVNGRTILGYSPSQFDSALSTP